VDKHKKIIVRENGKQITSDTDTSDETKYKNRYMEPYQDETAAMREPEEESTPKLPKKSNLLKLNTAQQNRNTSIFKTFVLPIASALIIGLILGFIMLRMFVNVEGNTANVNQQEQPPAAANQTENAAAGTEAEAGTEAAEVSPLSSYVLQGGVFSSMESAEAARVSYQEQGLPAVIWERDNQYFLFVGIAHTGEQIDAMEQSVQEMGLDAFSKEWSTQGANVELTESEAGWLENFQQEWEEGLQTVSANQELPPDFMADTTGNVPDSDRLITAAEEASAITEAENPLPEQVLIQLMNIYEKAVQ